MLTEMDQFTPHEYAICISGSLARDHYTSVVKVGLPSHQILIPCQIMARLFWGVGEVPGHEAICRIGPFKELVKKY